MPCFGARIENALLYRSYRITYWSRSYCCRLGKQQKRSWWYYFIDLRDKGGLVQLVADPADCKDALETAEKVRDEFVLIATGKVRARGEGLENPNLVTGKIEIVLSNLIIENRSKPMPFDLGDEKVNEEIRLRNRFLELRTKNLMIFLNLEVQQIQLLETV